MKVRFSPEAKQAILDIDIFYLGFSQQSCQNVFTDIYDVLTILGQQPEMGRSHPSKLFRMTVSSKYKFVITYMLHVEYVEILDIYRYQNRP